MPYKIFKKKYILQVMMKKDIFLQNRNLYFTKDYNLEMKIKFSYK